MTQPPKGSAAAPGSAPPPARPAVPAGPVPFPGQAARQGSAVPKRQPVPQPVRPGAWAQGTARLRAAATTEPGRLRVIAAVLAVLIVAFGGVTVWQSSARSAAAGDYAHRSQRLSKDAAEIYRSLADANTAASSGFLRGGQEPKTITDTYRRDIDTAAAKLAAAAASTGGDPAASDAIAKLNVLLPQYAGLIERARANNRQGLPLGGAYLRYANDLMQGKNMMLDQAEKLYQRENTRLDADYADARAYPWFAIAVGVVTLGFLGWAQRRNYLRTNRVFNHGLLGATTASTVVLLWLVVGHAVARSNLTESYDHGVRSVNVLHDAQIASLKARGSENLTLVNRGAETVTVKVRGQDVVRDKFDNEYETQMRLLGGADGRGGLLGEAARLADDVQGRQPVAGAVSAVREWRVRHDAARDADSDGEYQTAVDKVVGAPSEKPTGESFDDVEQALNTALGREQGEFEHAAEDGLGVLMPLAIGAAVLALLGAAGAVLGMSRRLSEYR